MVIKCSCINIAETVQIRHCNGVVKTAEMFAKNVLIFFLLFTGESSGFSCNKEECSCVDHIATCINVSYPSFFYRPTITILYMRGVQLNGITDILRSFPNLRYITLIDMVYFNCKWIKEIPVTIRVNTDNCMVPTGSKCSLS